MPSQPHSLPELHGCEKLAFFDWSEEISYFERVTITDQDEARAFLADEIAIDEDEVDPQPIHMRWTTPESGEVWTTPEGDEYDGGWVECEAEHLDAVPFWKDAP